MEIKPELRCREHNNDVWHISPIRLHYSRELSLKKNSTL